MSGQQWIMSFVVAVVAICAGMAWLGFRGRVTTVGVDLGTTFSVVGVSVNGKVQIIEDKFGHRIFPSIVAFESSGDVAAVAYDALPYLSLRPQDTIFNAKRFMGGDLADPTTQSYAASHPYKVVPATTLSNYSKVGFELSSSSSSSAAGGAAHRNATLVSPEGVGTQVLKYLMKVTAAYLGHNQVNKAVIAVPAKFSPEQRAATGEAYKAAGLKVVRVLEEPTAAAVAYKLHKKSNIHHILVYDFGGGTLDVSLLFVSKGSVQVYATDGDETLGGSDLDTCLFQIIKGRVEAELGEPLAMKVEGGGGGSSSKGSQGKGSSGSSSSRSSSNDASESDELCAAASIRTKAESAKKQLSSVLTTPFACTAPATGRRIAFDLTRADFESGCSELFARGLLPVTRLLTDLDMRKEDVDEVVLVGGTTRIPLVKQQLRDFFGKDLNDHIDPDVTVAYGAASVLD